MAEAAPAALLGNTSDTPFSVGDMVLFGTYPQTAEGTDNTPIDWLVLDVQDGKTLLISKYGLDAKPYNTKWGNNTWENTWEECTLRAWLNKDFLQKAFSREEQSAILMTAVDNGSTQQYSEWSTYGGNITQDQIFLLSYAEANKYFNVTYNDSNNTSARVAPTAYAVKNGAYASSSDQTADGDAAGWWWLRSPGNFRNNASYVYRDGSLRSSQVRDDDGCVRPVMWVDLSLLSGESGSEEVVSEPTPEPTPEPTAEPISLEVGSYIQFGTYPQTAEGTDSTPIDWLVLDVQDGKALLLSQYGLDAKPYNAEWKNVTWETCTLRTWLNGGFLQKAFSGEEQSAVLTTTIENSDKQGYNNWFTNGGNNTQDKIFLLSYAEANKYFSVAFNGRNNINAKVSPTDYAVKNGAYTSGNYKTSDGADAGWWWLRSPGYTQDDVSCVDFDGALNHCGVGRVDNCVRPALWLDLYKYNP